jgi:gamma-butyrobetaine dioxygenase
MDRNLCAESASLATVFHDERQLRINWADCHTSIFDSLWLRDNCPQDCDPRTGQRLVDIADLPQDPKLLSVRQVDNNALEVLWVDEPRSAQFSLSWIRQHCCCDQHRRLTKPAAVLWRGSDDGIRRVRYSDVLRSQDTLSDWLTSLVRYGIAFLSEVPCEHGRVTSVAALAGYITETNYGRIFNVWSLPAPNNLAYAGAGLGLHTDNPYRDPVPGFQFLHCLQASDEGGESLFADGFAVAEDMRAEDPEGFAVLSRTPVRFTFKDADSDLTAERPLISLDHRGDIAAIHYNNRSIAPLSLPGGEMRRFYSAYRLFSETLRDPRYIMRLRLQPGDLVAFYNHRVLHGRTGFHDLGVRRHLQGCYVSQDGIFSTVALLHRNQERVPA